MIKKPRQGPVYETGNDRTGTPVVGFVGPRSARLHRRTGLYVRSPKGMARRAYQVAAIVKRMRRHMEWIQDSDLPVCRQWADLELLRWAIVDVLSQDGVANKKTGVPHRLLIELRWITNSQLSYSRDVAMTPASRALIQATHDSGAFDLAEAAAQDALSISDKRRNGTRTPDEEVVDDEQAD